MTEMFKTLRILVTFFLALILMLQLTSVFLFYSYYIENGLDAYFFSESGEFKKTFFGVLEVIVPHLLSQGLVVFILSHFLILYKNKTKRFNQLALLLLGSCVLNIFSTFIVQLTGVSVIKLITFVVFQLTFLLSLYTVFNSYIVNRIRQ